MLLYSPSTQAHNSKTDLVYQENTRADAAVKAAAKQEFINTDIFLYCDSDQPHTPMSDLQKLHQRADLTETDLWKKSSCVSTAGVWHGSIINHAC